MEKEQIVSRLIDEIDIPSDKFGLAYDIIEYCVDSILKDLQNRSCENCKYNKKQDNFMIFCDKEMCQDGSKMMWHSFTKDFSCKFWERRR